MIKKKLIFIFAIILVLPLISAGGYGSGIYGTDVYVGNTTEVETPTPTPTPEAPSGGGGGGSSCSYDWQCTSWFPSICPESGMQERICANKGDCSGVIGMPNQTQACEYLGPKEPLFDIYLSLSEDNKELCSGDAIKASVKLENYGKVELLDAFMTYWVLDENNSLIAEMKDTRAVESETSFNVELGMPSGALEGTYRLYAEITYSGDKTALAGESFEIVSEEDCILLSRIDFNWNYLIYGGVGVIVVLLILGLIKLISMMFRKKKKARSHREYKSKVKQNLKKIRGKHFLITVFGFAVLGLFFIGGNALTGAAVGVGEVVEGLSGIIYFMIVIGGLGILSFVYREKIGEVIKTKRNRASKNSINGLIQKKVYAENGDYLGEVEEIILGENKIDSLKIKLDKKQKFCVKGAEVKYKNVKGVGRVVIIDERILEKLNI
jgi:sporulation protein YlmC with PRC-barrel domain